MTDTSWTWQQTPVALSFPTTIIVSLSTKSQTTKKWLKNGSWAFCSSMTGTCLNELSFSLNSKKTFYTCRFMPPDDPLGKNGPTLDQFLEKKVKLPSTLPQPCPYGKKCTYGNKCKFYHPDRGCNQKSVTDKLKENASSRIIEFRARGNSRDNSPGKFESWKSIFTSM